MPSAAIFVWRFKGHKGQFGLTYIYRKVSKRCRRIGNLDDSRARANCAGSRFGLFRYFSLVYHFSFSFSLSLGDDLI